MSRTYRGAKGPGYEYWGRRYLKCRDPGRSTKLLTHRRERLIGREACRKAL